MKRFFSVVVKVQRKITATLMLALIVVVTTQIVARMIFKISTPWTEELAKYLLIWIAFIGSIGALIKGEHLLVDIVYVRFSPRARKYARLANNVIYLFFTGFLFIYGVALCTNPIVRRSLTPAMQMPRVWLYVILPISMAFMVVYSSYDLCMSVKALTNHDNEEPLKHVAPEDDKRTLDEIEAEEREKR